MRFRRSPSRSRTARCSPWPGGRSRGLRIARLRAGGRLFEIGPDMLAPESARGASAAARDRRRAHRCGGGGAGRPHRGMAGGPLPRRADAARPRTARIGRRASPARIDTWPSTCARSISRISSRHDGVPSALIRAGQDVRLALRCRARDRGVRVPARVDARVEPVPGPARRPLRVVPLSPPASRSCSATSSPRATPRRSPRSTAGRRTGMRRTATPSPPSSPAAESGDRGSGRADLRGGRPAELPHRPPDGDRGLARLLPRRGPARPVSRTWGWSGAGSTRCAAGAAVAEQLAAGDRGRPDGEPLPDGSASARSLASRCCGPRCAVTGSSRCDPMRRMPCSSCPRTVSCARRPWRCTGPPTCCSATPSRAT